MFDEGPHYTGCPFGSQSELPAAPVFENIHLFFDNIRRFSDGALEQFDGFEGGSANFMKTKLLKQGAGRRFQALELRRFFRQDVMGTTNGLKFRHDAELYETYVY